MSHLIDFTNRRIRTLNPSPTLQGALENEIDSFFSRIDYELKILRAKGETADKKRIMRWLRKEQDDLMSYVKSQIKSCLPEEEKEEQEFCVKRMTKTIEKNFQILQIRYKED